MSWRFGLKAFLLILTLIAVLLGCHLRVDKQTRQLVGEISQGKTDRMLDAHLAADLLTDHELFLQKETGFMPMTESLPTSFLDLLLMKRRFRVTFSTTLRTTTSDDVQQVTWV